MEPQKEYARRLKLRQNDSARLHRHHLNIGYFRLSIFITAVVLAWFVFFAATPLSAWWLLLPVLLFIALLAIHSRIRMRQQYLQRAIQYYQRGLDRLNGRWTGTGNPGARFIDPHHPYSQDLDLFFYRRCAPHSAAERYSYYERETQKVRRVCAPPGVPSTR